MDDLSEQEEKFLNPSPRPYRVGYHVKILFSLIAIAGLSFYGYFLAQRRAEENRFLMNNELAAIKLTPTPLGVMPVIDPRNNLSTNLSFDNAQFVLLNVWATWCASCQQEMPSLALLQNAFGDKLKIIALSVDDDIDAVKNFVDENKPNFSVLWDKDKISLKLLGIEKYPETFLISPDGNVTTQFSGPRDWSSLQVKDYFMNILK